MSNDDPKKFLMSGYTGFVPRARGQMGMGYPLLTNKALCEFTDESDRLKRVKDLPVVVERPVIKIVDTKPIYLKDSGQVPHYTGHVPGKVSIKHNEGTYDFLWKLNYKSCEPYFFFKTSKEIWTTDHAHLLRRLIRAFAYCRLLAFAFSSGYWGITLLIENVSFTGRSIKIVRLRTETIRRFQPLEFSKDLKKKTRVGWVCTYRKKSGFKNRNPGPGCLICG